MASFENKSSGDFIRVADIGDIAVGGHRVIKSHGKQIAIFRLDEGRLYAIDNRCPHDGYPLADGALKGSVLTCEWHNWKFDLRDGSCLRGGEAVRSYPLQIQDGGVWLDLTDSDPGFFLTAARESFEDAIAKRDMNRVARDVLRLLNLGVSPEELITKAAAYAAERLEWGWEHGLTVAAECVRALPLYEGEQAVIPVTQAVAAVTDRSVRMPVRKKMAPSQGGSLADVSEASARTEAAKVFRQLIEEEDQEGAEDLFSRALTSGMGPDEAIQWLFPVVSDHFLNYGNALIYTVRALQMLARIGWQHAPRLLPCLVFQIAWSTREDRLPYMRRFQGMLRETEPELGALFKLQQQTAWSSSFDGEILFEHLLGGRLEEGYSAVLQALRAGVPFRMIADEISAAAAERCLRFDTRIDLNPRREEGWLEVTHLLTYANAMRTAFAMSPSPELLRTLFHGARFIHSTHHLDRPAGERAPHPNAVRSELPTAKLLNEIERAVQEMESARALSLVRGYIAAGNNETLLGAWLTRFAIADSASVDIMLAHTIKVPVAALEELSAIQTSRRELPLLAAIRFLASPKRERWVYPYALRALSLLAEGDPPMSTGRAR